MDGDFGPVLASLAVKTLASVLHFSTLLTLVAVVFARRLFVILLCAAGVAAMGPVVAAIPPLRFQLEADRFVLGFFAQSVVGFIGFLIARRVREKRGG